MKLKYLLVLIVFGLLGLLSACTYADRVTGKTWFDTLQASSYLDFNGNPLIPDQTGQAGMVLGTNGTNTLWVTGGGGGMIPLTSAHIYVGNGSNVATDVAASGDLTLDNTGKFTVTGIQGHGITLATGYLHYDSGTTLWTFGAGGGGITTIDATTPTTLTGILTGNGATVNYITDNSATWNTALQSAGTAPGTYNNVTVAASGLVTSGSNVSYLSTTLASGDIFVGNVSNVATAVALSGDATLTNTGTIALTGVNAGRIVYVPLTGDIQTYINNATAGDTLILGSGTYVITGTINVNKQINIVGQGNAGFYTIPSAAGHGTLIECADDSITAFNITSGNVRIANLSIEMTGDTCNGVYVSKNLVGLNFINMAVIIDGTGTEVGFNINSSTAVMRDLTFYITSSNGIADGVYFFNDSTATIDSIIDCFNVTGTVHGAATFAYAFGVDNNNTAHTITLNLSNSVCKALSGTPNDWAVATSSTTTSNATINAYMCTFDGADYDCYQTGTNQINLGGSVLVNNKVFGAVTYRATVAAGSFNGLVLTSAATGFTITGGTTPKTLTVNDNVTLPTIGGAGYLYQNGSGTFSWATPSGMTNPMTTLGDIIYENSTPTAARLAGDTSDTKKFLSTLSIAGVAQAPSWSTVSKSDVGLSNVENTALSTWAGTTNITTLGTITTGAWSGSTITPAKGGTGVANGTNNTITFTGNYTLGLTLSNNTALTLPTSGTLVTDSVTTLSSLASIGTITTGTWHGDLITGTYGGTGVNNGASTLTIAGNVTFSGAHTFTGTLTDNTSVTFPTSGTLVSSVTTGNGVSATNTAGALAFTLGAITPTSVNGLTLASQSVGFTIAGGTTPHTLTVTGDATISGTPLSNPMTTLGDVIYENATPTADRLAGDTSNTDKFLRSLSVAGVAQAPSWQSIAIGDLPTITTAKGGTGVANGTNNTITFTGNYTLGLTLSNNTAVTLPTSGTLMTTSDNAASATYASASTIVNDTTNATMYPVWVTANTGNLPLKVTSGNLTYNPSTGILTATTFSGALSGNATTASSVTGLSITAGKTLTVTDSATIATNSITLAGGEVITFTASNALTLATTGSTSVTLPTSGTLVADSVTTLSSLASIGTITTGTWHGSLITGTYGGTGVNNGTNTLTLAGNFVTSGAHSLTLTTTGDTNVTLPTSGTLISSVPSTVLHALVDPQYVVASSSQTTCVSNASFYEPSGQGHLTTTSAYKRYVAVKVSAEADTTGTVTISLWDVTTGASLYTTPITISSINTETVGASTSVTGVPTNAGDVLTIEVKHSINGAKVKLDSGGMMEADNLINVTATGLTAVCFGSNLNGYISSLKYIAMAGLSTASATIQLVAPVDSYLGMFGNYNIGSPSSTLNSAVTITPTMQVWCISNSTSASPRYNFTALSGQVLIGTSIGASVSNQ